MPAEVKSETPLPAIGGCRDRRSRKALALVAWPTLAAAVACVPAFDWRSVRLPETQLVAQLPCRPGRFQREMVVAGAPLKLFMLSCEAGGVTYGVATAEVGDAARVEATLAELAAGARTALRARDAEFASFKLAGATPFQGNVSARLRGMRPDGATAEESLRLFARGTRVFQVNAIGPALPEAVVKPFEDELRFDLENPPADPS